MPHWAPVPGILCEWVVGPRRNATRTSNNSVGEGLIRDIDVWRASTKQSGVEGVETSMAML